MKWKWIFVSFTVLIIVLAGLYWILNPEKNELNETTRARLGGQFIPLSDGFTHYKLEGPDDGKAVVLVHGATIPSWTWDRQVPVLIKAGFKVLTYDMYGRGYSDRPKTIYGRELYTRQLLELVGHLEMKEPFHLVGLSMGGATAVNFTAQYPARVRKLVLICPVINKYKVPSVSRIPIIGEFLMRIVGVRMTVKRAMSILKEHPRFREYADSFLEQTTYKGFQGSLLSMLRNDALGNYTVSYQVVGKQNRDVLLIWGTDDTEVTEFMIQDIQSFIPKVKFMPIDDAGHGIVFQKPEEVNRLILGFLGHPTQSN